MKRKSRENSATEDDLEIPETPPCFFKAAVMGKYHNDYMGRRGRKPLVAVALEEDVAAVFQDSESVNKVLRAIIASLPQTSSKRRRKSA